MTRSHSIRTSEQHHLQSQSRRVDSVYTEDTFATETLYAVSTAPGHTHHAHTHLKAHRSTTSTSNNTHAATQVPPIRAMKPQQHQHTTAAPRSHARAQQTTYNSHYHAGALRVVNPDPPTPRRKTFREVCAEQGEPLAKPRVRLLPHHIHPDKTEQLHRERQQRVAADDFGPGSMDGTIGARDLTMDDKREIVYRSRGAGSAGESGSVVFVEMGSTRRYTVAKQFELMRRGSGVEAKVRRGLLGFFGFKWR
ncbi:hypothetical protein M3J09_006039 [Ascochyta lentis]